MVKGIDTSVKALHGAPETARRMREAASRFLDALAPSQRACATFSFDDDERFFWHYTPIERQGLPLKDMEEHQRRHAYDLLASGLAPKAYLQAQAIIEHELILGELERAEGTQRFDRDPGLYFFSVFGDPTSDAPWGYRIEGHHLSLHYTIVDAGLLAVTPCFFGANPARVPQGPKQGLRIHSAIEDLAKVLLLSLEPPQRARAQIWDNAPRDIVTTNSRQAVMERMEGVAAASMSRSQRQTLRRLVGAYVSRMPPEVATRELGKLEARGFDALHFAWAGGLEMGQPLYYRIHSPAFLIEYDNFQNGANHIHSVRRDFESDFGLNLLRQQKNGE